MDRLELSDGYVNIQQVTATEGVGYELQFEVAKGSAIDVELQRCFNSGELLPITYAGEDLAVSITTVNEQTVELRRYVGAAGFLRPGMGGAGG